MNIVKELEKALQDSSMVLANPNTTLKKEENNAPDNVLLKRAVICSSLAASYLFTRDEKNAFDFVHTDKIEELFSRIIEGKMSVLENKIASFGNRSSTEINVHDMLLIALNELTINELALFHV